MKGNYTEGKPKNFDERILSFFVIMYRKDITIDYRKNSNVKTNININFYIFFYWNLDL